MFKNSQKISISKHFLISLLLAALIFASIGISMDDVCASDLNQSVGGIESELNIEDKLGNSQENIADSNMEVDNLLGAAQNNDVLGATVTVNGGKFSDIRKAIEDANEGDTIKLNGTFVAEKANDIIKVRKTLTFTADSMATLDANNLTYIFDVGVNAKGSVFNNIKFVNAYNTGVAGGIFVKTQNVKVTNCIFEDGYAKQGAGISTEYNNQSGANLWVENCQFINNHAQRTAAAIAAYGNNTTFVNCLFDSNGVYNNGEYDYIYGGAIQIGLDDSAPKGYIYNCIFKNNYVDPLDERAHGGAGCVRDGITYENCIFINNSAGQGGALTYHASGLIKNCTFINNTATYFGGALSTGFVEMAMALEIENCSFEGNVAPIGGAVQLMGNNINIEKCNFDNNNASQTGGAVNVNAEYVGISDSSFNRNIANVDGGAVFINGESTSIKNSSFISNHAIPDVNKLDDGLGGAIYVNSTLANIQNNDFYYNTARNGSAIYYDKRGVNLNLNGNEFYQNQAWVYLLPIYAKDIYYGETENISSVIHGGNNIAKYNDVSVSNAVYNAADNRYLVLDGESPVSGATTSGHLYQDDREYNMDILLTVTYEDGSVVYNKTIKSDCFGEVSDSLKNLKVGKYYVTARHYEDTYYKAIANTTAFSVIPKIDNKVKKAVSQEVINYNDIVVWTLNVTNNGPNDATNVIIRDVLPDGLIYLDDDTDGAYNPQTGILKINSLKVGEVFIINIKTAVNKTGGITNDVNVTAKEYDYNLNNNHDQSNINVDPACDLEVIKSANVSSLNFGEYVKWTIDVINHGPDVATGVVVIDVLPRSLIWVDDDGLGKYDHNSGSWDIGTLDINGHVKLNVICKVNATGTIKNEASVSAKQYDFNETNNHDDEIIHVNPSSDLKIVKEVNSSVVNYLDVVKWTLTVSNNGPDAASGVKIYDVLPKGFVYLNSSIPSVNGVMNVGNLDVGGKVIVEIFSRATVTGDFVNVASVNGSEYDYDPSNNHDNASVHVKPATDLMVTKDVNNSSPNFADEIEWTLTVKNNGPDSATGVVVSDVLPKSLIWVSDDGLGKYNHNSGIWDIGNLNKNANVKLTIVCRVNATGKIENKASVTGKEFDWNLSNNNAQKQVNVAKASDLGIVKEVSPASVNYLDVVKWTLTVTNYGPDAASGVWISDVLPRGFVYLNSTKSYSNGRIDIGDLEVGGKVIVEIYSRATVTGDFVNVASVNGSEYDPNHSNNHDNASVHVKPATDLLVSKNVNNSSPNFNDSIKWTLTVTNNGPDIATGVVVSDVLPKSLIWIDDDSLGKYDINSGIWNVGTLKKGQTEILNIITKVNATGMIENNVSVSGKEFDFNKSNNNDTKRITVENASDLAVIKLTNSSVVNYLQLVKWTIIATNYGPDKATEVTVDEILPNGLKVVNYTATKGFYDDGVWAVCCIESGESQTLELVCEVLKTGNLTNIVKITGKEYDPDLSNNVANESIFVPKSSDIGVVKTVDYSNPDYGDAIEWTITVTNNGPDDAEDILVIDLLNSGLRLDSYKASAGNYIDGSWHIDYLANGASESLVLRCFVNTLDDVENVVTVVPSQYDWNESNNNDSEMITVNPVADLGIIKMINVSEANYHDLVEWSLIVTNYGPNDATNVFASDVIPDGLDIVEVFGDGSYSDSIWEIGDLANGDSKQLVIVCKVQATGNFKNTANVWASETDPNLSNNDDENYLYVYPASDLSITKTVSKYRYSVGDLVKYSIKLTNNGPDVAENVKVNEIMDKSMTLKSFHASAGDFDKVNDVWSLDFLEVGQSATLKIDAVANEAGVVENKVSATSDNFDPDLSNNNDTVSIDVGENQKPHENPKTNEKHSPSEQNKEFKQSILMANKSGNPIMVIVLLFVFTMGALYGNNILKKR